MRLRACVRVSVNVYECACGVHACVRIVWRVRVAPARECSCVCVSARICVCVAAAAAAAYLLQIKIIDLNATATRPSGEPRTAFAVQNAAVAPVENNLIVPLLRIVYCIM